MRRVIDVPFRIVQPEERVLRGPDLQIDDMVGESLVSWTPLASAIVGCLALLVVLVGIVLHFYPPRPADATWKGAAIASCYLAGGYCGLAALGLSVKLYRMIQEDRRLGRKPKWNKSPVLATERRSSAR